MNLTLDTLLTFVLIVSAAIWIGGVITVIVLALVSKRTLNDEARVELFRTFGRTYLIVAGLALAVTAVIGWTFLARLEWSTELTRMAFASTLLVVVLIAGVIQARNQTQLRAQLVAAPEDTALANKVQSRAIAATVLRTLIILITIGLTVHVAALLTSLL